MGIAKRVLLFLMVNILVVFTLSIFINISGFGRYLDQQGLHPVALLGFCFIWGMGGALISLLISKKMAKWMMSVQVIDADMASGPEKEIVDVIHGLAKRAGLTTMPEVGIYESPEINAFATGPTKNNSLVAVSSGLLHRMDKNQLEGVLGHEISHIVNGDMVTMTLLQGVVNAFVMFFARVIAWVISQGTKEENRYVVYYLVTFVLELIFLIFGSLLVSAFSRAREFRADKGGAQLAGKDKMIDALETLKGTLNRIDTEHASFNTLKISGHRGSFFALFSSHPPLEERIARLKKLG